MQIELAIFFVILKVLEDQVSKLQGDFPQPQAMPIYDVCGSSVEDNKTYLKQMNCRQVWL